MKTLKTDELFHGISGAIFDLDGTLLDSMSVWRAVDVAFFHKRGMELPGGYTDAVKAMNFPQAAEYTIRRCNLAESAEAVVAEWNAMVGDAYARRLPLKPGAEALLRSMRGGGVRLGLATASRRELYEPALRRNGVFELFDAFTTTDEVARGKGFPDIYLRAAEKLGVAPCRCAVFEDILAGIRGAKAAGMRAVGVYDLHSASERPHMERLADAYVEDFTCLVPAAAAQFSLS